MQETGIFARRIKSENGKYIVLVTGNYNNKKSWYYVLSDQLKMPMLVKKCQNKAQKLNLDNYGRVLKMGWGEQPPEYIQHKIEKEGGNFDNSEFDATVDAPDERFFVRSQDAEGRKFYVFIEVFGHLAKEFQKVVTYGACDISAYGNIIEIGWGEPPEDVAADMLARGFELVD